MIHPFKIIKIYQDHVSTFVNSITQWYVLVRPGMCSFQLKDADHQPISAQSLWRNVHISALWREFSWGKGTYLVHTWRRSELDLCCYAQGGLPLGKRMGNVEGCQVRVGELRLGLEVGPPKRQNQDESGWIENNHTRLDRFKKLTCAKSCKVMQSLNAQWLLTSIRYWKITSQLPSARHALPGPWVAVWRSSWSSVLHKWPRALGATCSRWSEWLAPWWRSSGCPTLGLTTPEPNIYLYVIQLINYNKLLTIITMCSINVIHINTLQYTNWSNWNIFLTFTYFYTCLYIWCHLCHPAMQ